MNELVYYIIDIETNGLVWKNNFHEVCDFSIIRAKDRVQLSKLVRVERPENSSIDALQIIKRSSQDLLKGISKIELINEVEEFIKEDGLTDNHRVFVGHNSINFDRKFLWQLWEKYDKIFPMSLYLDTMQLMKKYVKDNGLKDQKSNLTASCDHFAIAKYAKTHSAKDDTKNTYLLWQKLIEVVDYLPMIKRIPHKTYDNDNEE